jgi:superfamily II DNA or RNA helicase
MMKHGRVLAMKKSNGSLPLFPEPARESVQVTLDHRSAYITASAEMNEELRDFWSFSVPGAYFSDKVRDGIWDGRIRLYSRGRLPAGLFRATYADAAEHLNIQFDIQEDYPDVEFLPALPITDYKYAYQHECVDRMCDAVRRGGGIILAATSAGKTKISSDLMYRMPQQQFLFVVDQLNLLYQAQEEFASRLKCRIGVVGDSQFDPARVTVATIQTLSSHQRKSAFRKWFDNLDVIFVDELHEQMARRNFKLLHTIEPMAVFGLTATLELNKKPIRYNAFSFAGPVIFEFTVEEGMRTGVLNKGAVLQLVFDEVDWNADDHREEYNVQVLENNVKHEAARRISVYLIKHNRHVVQLVSRIAHLQTMTEKMGDIRHATLWGGTKKNRRERAVARFEAGKIPLLIANQVMKKGVSVNIIDAIIDLAEQKSRNDAVQKFGRGLRLSETGTPLLYIDFSTRSHDVVRGRDLRTDECSRAGKARAREFKKRNIPVRRIAVHSADDALLAVKKILRMFEVGNRDS